MTWQDRHEREREEERWSLAVTAREEETKRLYLVLSTVKLCVSLTLTLTG